MAEAGRQPGHRRGVLLGRLQPAPGEYDSAGSTGCWTCWPRRASGSTWPRPPPLRRPGWSRPTPRSCRSPRTAAARAGRAAALLPERPGLPRGRRRPGRADGRALRAATRPWPCGTSATSTAATCRPATATCRRQAFRAWLAGALRRRSARLNEAWGGAVWSQDYTSWDQVQPPRAAPTFANPAQQLDFARFSSDELLACYRAERAVLAEHSPARRSRPTSWACSGRSTSSAGRPSSTSSPWTATPTRPIAEAHVASAMAYDLTRSVGGGKPWMLMEQAPSAVNWRPVNVPKAPGQYRGAQPAGGGPRQRRGAVVPVAAPRRPARRSSTAGCCRTPGPTAGSGATW